MSATCSSRRAADSVRGQTSPKCTAVAIAVRSTRLRIGATLRPMGTLGRLSGPSQKYQELEAQWLVSHPSPSQNKRKAPHIGDSEPRHTKRSAAGPITPVRCSPRYHHTPMTEPTVVQDTEAPSPLAASHQNHRPQLTLAFRRLYGTAQHRGILAGLAILKLYCECLGHHGNPKPAL